MSKIDDGGPAFAISSESYEGMSLRDWFAGQALVGILPMYGADPGGQSGVSQIANWAYMYADAMIQARKEKP